MEVEGIKRLHHLAAAPQEGRGRHIAVHSRAVAGRQQRLHHPQGCGLIFRLPSTVVVRNLLSLQWVWNICVSYTDSRGQYLQESAAKLLETAVTSAPNQHTHHKVARSCRKETGGHTYATGSTSHPDRGTVRQGTGKRKCQGQRFVVAQLNTVPS